MANFQKVSDSILKNIPASFTADWKSTLKGTGIYSLFDAAANRVIIPNNESTSEKGFQSRLIGMWGGQASGQRLDVIEVNAKPGVRVELVSETPFAPHLWVWRITAELPICLVRSVEAELVGVTTVAEPNRAARSEYTARMRLTITPESAIGSNLPSWAGGTPDETRDAILSECERQGVLLDTQVAYLLATCQHECGFRPIREGQFGGHTAAGSESFRRGLSYYPYYGRGYVQLTHKAGYKSYGGRLQLELVDDPDLALDPAVALFVLVHGVMNGSFGSPLTRFVNARQTDFVHARRSVNVMDRAEAIATIATRWLTWVRANHPTRFTRGFEARSATGVHALPLGRTPAPPGTAP